METLRLERRAVSGGEVAIVTLHRPEARNAINKQMIDELSQVLETLAHDGQTRALIITGAGEKAFAAGADIAELKARDHKDALRRINSSLFRRIEEHPLPSIAAIRGFALGGGCELAMACDIRVAGESARFGQPEVGLGIIAGAGAVQRLPRLVGVGRAKELLLTGRVIDAQEADRIGLVNRVVADELVLETAIEIGERIALQAPLAVEVTKMAVNAAAGTSIPYDSLDVLGQAMLFDSADKHARMGAFLDKRNTQKEGHK